VPKVATEKEEDGRRRKEGNGGREEERRRKTEGEMGKSHTGSSAAKWGANAIVGCGRAVFGRKQKRKEEGEHWTVPMPRINPIAPNGSWGGDGGKMKEKRQKKRSGSKWERMAWRGE
jgi:hypothetical protein